MKSFAIYRFPHQQSCTLIAQDSGQEVWATDFSILDSTKGFAVAPFNIDTSHPLIVIQPQRVETFSCSDTVRADLIAEIDACSRACSHGGSKRACSREDYSEDFQAFHARLTDGTFDKLVLSREKIVDTGGEGSAFSLFDGACHNYPRLFIALFSSASCGTWLVATPELLTGKDGNECTTMALAGTMPYNDDMHPIWSEKNIAEQEYVTRYIADNIRLYAQDIDITGPYTARAGALVHLRTDFSFTVKSHTPLSAIVGTLHPTPAVCGLPKARALDFILGHEHSQRKYYSGFCGPIHMGGSSKLFVSLRCMEMRKGSCHLFAGGGILPHSTEESEWQETENKMQTILKIIAQTCTATKKI